MVDNITVHEVEGSLYDEDAEEVIDFKIGPVMERSVLEDIIETLENKDERILIQHRYNTIERGETERNDTYFQSNREATR